MPASFRTSKDRVLRIWPQKRPACRLLCFPFLGGNGVAFSELQRFLDQSIELIAYQPPGREMRFTDSLAYSFEQAVHEAYLSMRPYLDKPLVIFGHSNGALLAYEFARKVEGEVPQIVKQLYIGAQEYPDAALDKEIVSVWSDDEIMAFLTRLNIGRTETLSNRSLMQVILPSIRAEFRMAETYTVRPQLSAAYSIGILLGEDDRYVNVMNSKPWEQLFPGPVEFKTFPGGHFFVQESAELVAQYINDGARRTILTNA
jgi:surfactin synthase thioesterase subunit